MNPRCFCSCWNTGNKNQKLQYWPDSYPTYEESMAAWHRECCSEKPTIDKPNHHATNQPANEQQVTQATKNALSQSKQYSCSPAVVYMSKADNVYDPLCGSFVGGTRRTAKMYFTVPSQSVGRSVGQSVSQSVTQSFSQSLVP